jgi:Xaa-Pro aminopeptidase
MARDEVDAVVLTHPQDVFYYAGTVRPATLLVGPREGVLFVRRGLDLARREATVERVEGGGGFRQVAQELSTQRGDGGMLGLAMDVLPARLYHRTRKAFPNWALRDISDLVLAQRMVKDGAEVESVRRAGRAADAGHAAVSQVLHAGMTELELVAEVEAATRRAGHEGHQPLRHPGGRGGGVLLMSGENLTVRGGHGLVVTGVGLSPASPYGVSRRPIQPGDLIVVDIGATFEGYTADESRTFVLGEPSPAQEALVAVALAVEEAVLWMMGPGVTAAEVYAAAQGVVGQGAPPHFAPGELVLPGFVGHGIGLELDEPPVLWPREETRIEAGMVLAVEVEVSAPAAGTMVKIEDTVLIGQDGSHLLTAAPRRLIAV